LIPNDAGWTASRSGLLLHGRARLSFQRYLLAHAPPLPTVPTSLGSLEPHALTDDAFLVPLHQAEAVWIGVEFSSEATPLRIRAADEPKLLPITISSAGGSPLAAVACIASREGLRRFALSPHGVSNILVEVPDVDRVPASIQLIDPAGFGRITGQLAPGPASADDGYQGWRLP
jgi:hypothetical protein